MLLFNRSSEGEYLLYDGWLHDPPFCRKGKGVQLFSGNNDFSATVNFRILFDRDDYWTHGNFECQNLYVESRNAERILTAAGGSAVTTGMLSHHCREGQDGACRLLWRIRCNDRNAVTPLSGGAGCRIAAEDLLLRSKCLLPIAAGACDLDGACRFCSRHFKAI